jgi:hypothetical protein
MALLDLPGGELEIAVLGVAAGMLWLGAAAFFYAARHPADPPVGPRTLDLGPEPPAVANFLVHGFRVTDEAVAATLIDLAARRFVEVEQRGPGVFYIRLRSARQEPLTPYERRVLSHLERLASGGVVPAEALTTGPADVSSGWRREFESEVVADAQGRGLSRDAVRGSWCCPLWAPYPRSRPCCSRCTRSRSGSWRPWAGLWGGSRPAIHSGRHLWASRLRRDGSASARSSPRTRSSPGTRR